MLMQFPWPPSVNHYWRHDPGGMRVRGGRRFHVKPHSYLTDRAKRYVAEVQTACLMNRWRHHLTGRLSLRVTLHPATRARLDIDNFCKGLFDAMTKAGVWADDSQIDSLHILRGELRKPGMVQVEVLEVADE